MFALTDETVDAVIDSTSGFIIATVTAETGIPIGEIAVSFYASDIYALLGDKATGYYFDSIPEMIERFYAETPHLAKARCEKAASR